MMLRSKTFLRYMLSYALVLFLPMLVLCMVFYFAALDRFTEEVTLSTRTHLYMGGNQCGYSAITCVAY